MKRLLLTAILFFTSTVWAGPMEDASAARTRGDHAAALKIAAPWAAKGEAWAQLFLGDSYRLGVGAPKNLTEAAKWYRLSAAQGHANGQYNLGVMYDKGEGVVQDYTEAVKWYRLSAAQGYARGQYNLGLMYAKGEGIPMDHVRAHMWFNLVAVKGDSDAVKNRDIIARLLTPRQMAEAQKLARECQARQFKNCD